MSTEPAKLFQPTMADRLTACMLTVAEETLQFLSFVLNDMSSVAHAITNHGSTGSMGSIVPTFSNGVKEYCLTPTFSCHKARRSRTSLKCNIRQLIKRRQRAFLSGQTSLYHQLRNQANRMAATLRKQYFQRKIQSLHSLDPHSWWSKIKHFLHPSDPNPYRCK